MANPNARFQLIKANSLNDEGNRLAAAAFAVNQATFSDNALYGSTQVEQDAMLQIANARLTAQTALVAAINLL